MTGDDINGSPPRAPSRSRWASAGWSSAGMLLVAFGAAGIVLPLVPTTPFLLLAGACFLRGSPRLHRWLHANRLMGPYLHQWETERTIPPRAKAKAIVVVVLTFTASAVLVDHVALRASLVVLAGALVWFLHRLRTAPPLAERGVSSSTREPRAP